MFMQQMASDIFVRILRGMGACRKKPAQPASGSQLDDSIGNTPTTVSWRVWGYEVGLGWRLASSGISLPNNVFSWLLSDFTGPFSRPKNPSKTCAPQGASPVGAALGKNAASFNLILNTFSRQALTGYTLEFSGCMLLKKWSLRVQIVRFQK